MRRLLLLGLALALIPSASGALTLLHTESSGNFRPVEVEVPFGQHVAGSTLGANQTNASVSIAGSLLETTTDILYINNTNATGAHHARLEVIDTTNLANLDLLKLGIDNGTTTDQIVIETGTVLDSDGTYVKLEPGSTNTIYVTQSLSALTTTSIAFYVYSADDPQESAFVKTRAELTLT